MCICLNSYYYFLLLHSYLRWFILGFAIILAVLSILAYNQYKKSDESTFQKPSHKTLKNLSFILVTCVDISFLLGLFLYIRYWSQNVSEGIMSNPEVRKRLIEHGPAMLVVLILVHIANAMIRKKVPQNKKYLMRMFVFYIIIILLIVAVVPSWALRFF